MFGIGMPEMLLILAVALIVIGPKKLPDLAKSIGRAIGEFKRAATDFKESMEIDNELKEVRKAFDDINDLKTPIDVSPDPENKSSGSSTDKKKDAKEKDAEKGSDKRDSEKEKMQEGTLKNDK